MERINVKNSLTVIALTTLGAAIVLLFFSIAFWLINQFPGQNTLSVGVVDEEKIMNESMPGKAGKEHMDFVRDQLQKTLDATYNEWANAPADERDKVMNEMAYTLNTLIQVETDATNLVVRRIMLDEVRKWRADHKGIAVVPKSAFLDIDRKYLITDDIIEQMTFRQPKFSDVPKFEVKKRSNVTVTDEKKKFDNGTEPQKKENVKTDSKDGGKPSSDKKPAK